MIPPGGPYFKWPWERVHKVSITTQTVNMAFDPERDRGLRLLDASHLFPRNTTRVALRRGAYLRSFVYAFAELISSRLSRALIERAMTGDGDDYDL